MTAALATATQPFTRSASRAACVVVAFHRPEALRCLLAELRDRTLEIIVVNVENDAEVSSVAEGCTLVGVDRNIGYAAAVNLGARHATAPFVVFMNDDVVVSAQAVHQLVGALERGADVAVPRVVDRDGRTERTIAAVPTPSSLVREWLLLPDAPVRGLRRLRVEKWRAPDGAERVPAASALLVATRQELLREHPLPEDYFLYWEESEWFWRLDQRRALVEYHPETVCRHDGGRDDVRPEKSRLLARNAVRCIRRTQGRAAASFAYAIVIAWNLRLAIVDSTRTLLRPRDGIAATRARARWVGVGAAVGAIREIR